MAFAVESSLLVLAKYEMAKYEVLDGLLFMCVWSLSQAN